MKAAANKQFKRKRVESNILLHFYDVDKLCKLLL